MNAPTDLNALKSRQQTAWASGDYAVIVATLAPSTSSSAA